VATARCGGCVLSGDCRGCSIGLVEPGSIVYASYVDPEAVGLYNTVPGGLVLRIVVPGAPPSTPPGEWWGGLGNLRALAVRRVGVKRLAALVESAKPDAVLVDGAEPLLIDWVPELLERIEGVVRIVRSHALAAASVLRSLSGLFEVLLLEYSRSLAWLGEHVSRLVVEASSVLRGVEVYVRHDGGLWARRLLRHLAAAYPTSPLSLVVEGVAGYNPYEEVKTLRRVKPHTYLHGDTTYTLVDTLCVRCRNPLVSRKPWGVTVRAERGGDGSARCRTCRVKHPWVILPARRRKRLGRELMVL